MLAESIIASLVSLDVFLFVREYRASVSHKSVNASTQSHFMKNDCPNRCEDGQRRSAIAVVRRRRGEIG
jgi:hypothetical protein